MSYLRAELPPIALHSGDLERLGRLANAALERYPQTAGFLAREVARADIVTSLTPPRGLVIMGSKVEFSTDGSDQTRCVTLVYPIERKPRRTGPRSDADGCGVDGQRSAGRSNGRALRSVEHADGFRVDWGGE